MKTAGDYYDGISSKRHVVTLHLSGAQLRISGEGINLSLSLNEVRMTDPLGTIKRSLYLANGGKCDFEGSAFALQLEARQRKKGFFSGVHRWENSLKLAFAALVLSVVLILGFIQFGIPVLAEQAAYVIPPTTEISLGEETLQILERTMFQPSELNADRQTQLAQLFARVVSALDATERPYRLEMYASKIGANAFALPGGIVIMTDELVEIAGADEEIAAVLAHEVGHVRHRHAMRQVIQNSSVGLMIATLTGDVFSASSLVAALPTLLVDAKFSRDMELEADDVAVEYLQTQGQPVDHFTGILTRLEQAFAEKHGSATGEGAAAHYFSSHPATKERIERLGRKQN